jgi:hypothetical protein
METMLDPVPTSHVKLKEEISQRVAMVPATDGWRLQYLARLLWERGEAYYRGEETDQMNSLIWISCV